MFNFISYCNLIMVGYAVNLRLNLLILVSIFFQPIEAMELGGTALKFGFDNETQEFLKNMAKNPPKIALDLSGLGRDGSDAAKQIGEGFSKGLGGALRGEFKELFEQIGTDVPEASDKVMSGVAQAFNRAFREGSREFTGELNGQVAPEFDKFAGSMSGTARHSIEQYLLESTRALVLLSVQLCIMLLKPQLAYWV
jgi:hypothetical protein